MDSYATPTLIIISFSLDNELCHNIKRTQLKSVDINKIDQVNDLSRSLSNHQIPLEEFHQKLIDIDNQKKYSDLIMIIGAAICTFGFALFFGGNFKDALSAFIIGGIIKTMNLKLDVFEMNSFFKYLISGALATFLSILFNYLGICQNLDTTIISVDMLLVPGLAITNAMRDTVDGNLVSGMARAMEAIFIAVAIAIGSALIFMMLGGY